MRPLGSLFIIGLSSLFSLAGCASAAAEDDAASGADEAITGTTVVEEATGPSTLNTQLDALYSQADKWQGIADKAYGEVGYDTPPCATFESFALERLVGVKFPASHAATIHVTSVPSLPVDGVQPHTFVKTNATYQVRYNTSGLSSYLMQQGFKIVWEPKDLLPGDLVYVLPADYGHVAHPPLHPAHTYMFHEWVDDQKKEAWVVDNEADGYCAPDEDPKDKTFIAYCDAASAGPLLCCRGTGLHQYKRSVSVSAPEPEGAATPGEIDQRMWFALRAPR